MLSSATVSIEPPNPAALDSARSALYDPDLREWPAPPGVLGEPAGLRSTFEAMRFRSVVEEEPGEIRFEAWRTPRATGAVVSAILAAIVYLALDRWGVSEFRTIVVIVLVAWYVPTWLLPTYRISGKIAGGRVQFRMSSRGVLARPRRLEQALRFYLTPGKTAARAH